MNIVPIILSGGKGTRLWPLSRSMRPKQFINLIGGESLFQTTINRVKCIDGITAPIIVCNEEHRFMVAEQLQELDSEHNAIILEPVGKNTAPAIASAAYKLSLIDKQADVCMLVLPADHVIENPTALSTAVAAALESAKNGRFVTFGISPNKPATGYGYLKVSSNENDSIVKNVEAFVEKPDLATATEYVNSGDYFWNGGMFLMKVSTFLKELETAESHMCSAIKASVSAAQCDLDFFRLGRAEYDKSPSISIDYALMEKSSRVSMVELRAGWNDIGSWSSLWETGEKDSNGNVTKGDVMLEAVTDCYVHSENRLLSAIGVRDLIIVETHDGIMVSSKNHDQGIKHIVSRLQEEGRTESELHRKAFRPWGNYDCLDQGERFQVKRIMVKPGQCTSMQKHFKRAEHWIVVSGTAEVTCADKTFILEENESTFIPLGAQHRLKNPGQTDLELIEVQSGAYLGEDDIVRIDDEYGRC